MQGWLVALVLCASCAGPRSVTCDDGTVCAEGLVCALDRCLTPDEATACKGLSEGDLCRADDRDARCTSGACLPACGDGVLDSGDQCDDANYVSHDGCSSACLLETRAWELWPDPWRPRSGHAAAYDSDRKRLVLFGGNSTGFIDDTWERIELASGSTWSRVVTPGPSARISTMAYDPVRKVTVLFGGFAGAYYADTWEFDGVTWKLRTLATSPEPRARHAMVFDEVRGKIVLFGGIDGTQLFGDTWTYDGAWTKIATTGPGARSGAAIAFDPARQTVVLFGGGVDSVTWELGATWTSGPNGPSARASAAMAYAKPAGSSGALVLFGGNGLADTWQYDGTWSRLTLDDQPSGTSFHTLTSVPAPESGAGAIKLVLVGGRSGTSASDQLWEFGLGATQWTKQPSPSAPRVLANPAAVDGLGRMTLWALDGALWTFDSAGWTAHSSTTQGPLERSSFAFALDSARGKSILHGGSDLAQVFNSDTWQFDGTSTVDVTMPGDPPGRAGAVAAYDATRNVVVMVGGVDSTNTTLDQTWEFDGAWHLRTTPTSPGPQQEPAMAYDPITSRVVLLANDGTTWAYDGAWEQLSVPPGPAVVRAALTFDPARRRLVLFGGRDVDRTLFADAYELDASGWQRIEVDGEAPSPRQSASLAYVPSVHALVMFGGRETALGFDDTWLLAYRSATPDEECGDGQDNDGDARVDSADPDCGQ